MLSRNGIVGISPLDKAREAIGLGLAAENYGARFFGKGGNYKAVMETDKQLDDPEWKKFNKRINSYTDHDIPLLEYGIKYKDIGISPEQAQFVSSRTFQLQDIARFFNVPPHIIGDLSRATFSNIEHQDIQFVKYSLRSLLKRQEVELETKLAPMDGTEKPDIKYILDGMLRGDTKTRAAYYQALVPLGIITRNEAREEENRSPLPGLDEPLNPANITGKSAEPKPPADPDEDIKPKSDEDAEE
jgi:HK97 family phage portal protein